MAKTAKCHNCGKAIPPSAKACAYCEAAVADEPTEEEKQAVLEMTRHMDPQTLAALKEAIDSSETAEDFINAIFVGPCPKCDSEHTGDCENDPEAENPCIGLCLDCGCHWCTECDRIFEGTKTGEMHCPCWDEEIPGLEDL